ncbi:MAG: hypothetical protein AB7W16_10495 [Candidatus Obscuribacterales bacterium]
MTNMDGTSYNTPEDFPAAHSMDTAWFAVDKDGFVAFMDSSEPGAVPYLYGYDQDYKEEVVEAIAANCGLSLKRCEYDLIVPESAGLYNYSCDFDYPGEQTDEIEAMDATPPYKLRGRPDKPVHISELPENLASYCKTIEFRDLSFKETEWIQPALKVPCFLWGDDETSVIDDTGKVVPVPSHLKPPINPPESPLVSPVPPKAPEPLKKHWFQKFFGI